MSEDDKICDHPACDCEVNEDTEYCSSACAEDTEGRCHCKHSDCSGRNEPPAPRK